MLDLVAAVVVLVALLYMENRPLGWKRRSPMEMYFQPCADCGEPTMSLTPGIDCLCQRCFSTLGQQHHDRKDNR